MGYINAAAALLLINSVMIIVMKFISNKFEKGSEMPDVNVSAMVIANPDSVTPLANEIEQANNIHSLKSTSFGISSGVAHPQRKNKAVATNVAAIIVMNCAATNDNMSINSNNGNNVNKVIGFGNEPTVDTT